MSKLSKRPILISRRPYHEGALNLGDIRNGLKIVVHLGGMKQHFTIVGDAYMRYGRGYWVNVVNTHSSNDAPVPQSLSDMGVAPYPDGRWNAVNYTTRDLTGSRNH